MNLTSRNYWRGSDGGKPSLIPYAERATRPRSLVALLFLFLVAGFSPAQAEDELCPEGDLTGLAGVAVSGAGPGADRAIDGRFVEEGGPTGPRAASLDSPLRIDLGAVRSIDAILVQAEADDDYVVEGSIDGENWETLSVARASDAGGMRSRALRLAGPVETRHLRISGAGGDGSFSVAEIAAWCGLPSRPPSPETSIASRERARRVVRGIQFGTALAGTLLLGWGFVLQRSGRAGFAVKTRDALLAGLGLLAALCWWNLGGLHFGRYLHLTDHYHYFLGAKYFTELGHDRLYECTAVADVEEGLGDSVRQRRIRNMHTNRLESTAGVLADPDRCKDRFTPARWEEFRRDLSWFRGSMPPPRWERTFVDHGYNAPPAWGILGAGLARSVPASNGTILALALIDPLLLMMMWGFVIWGFGWRNACVAALWWGTNQLEGFSWTGGAFLRQDWLLLTVAGICLVKRRWMASGGFALTYATLLRVFPGFLVAALVLRAATRLWRDFRAGNGFPSVRDYSRFAVGCLAAVIVILPLSFWSSGGPSAWGAFAENSRANLRSTGTNMIGLMVVLSYEHENRWEALVKPGLENPEDRWLEAKRDVFERRRPLFWVLALAFVVLLWRAVRDEPDWAALTLGIGLIPILTFLACYYYSILLGLGLLYGRRDRGTGILLCALSVATHVTLRAFPSGLHYDQRYALNSLATVAVVVAITAAYGFGKRSEGAD